MKKRFSFIIFVIFLLCSCSTTLKMNVIRPAKLDLKGANTIGVLPFSHSNRFPFYSNGVSIGSKFDSYAGVSGVEYQVLNYIYKELEKGLIQSPYINLVDSSLIINSKRNKTINPADVYISGEMVVFNIFDDEKIVKKEIKPEDSVIVGNAGVIGELNVPSATGGIQNIKQENFIIEKYYTREVLLVFNYQIVNGKDDSVIYFNTLKIDNRSDFFDDLKKLPDPYYMISYDLEEFVSSLLELLQPYSLTRNITLLDDKSKNSDMEQGKKLAKDGKLRESYTVFYDIYNSIGLFEAGYNASMILMVLGDLTGAENLMRTVYNKSENIKASEGLSDIMNEIRQKKILEEQLKR